MRSTFALIALVLTACGGSGSNIAAPVPPASVVVTDAALTAQSVSLHLHNNGGPGDYYLEFWALPISPNGAARITQTSPATVLKGYDETLGYQVVFGTVAVKVKSRAINTAVYALSDCRMMSADANYC